MGENRSLEEFGVGSDDESATDTEADSDPGAAPASDAQPGVTDDGDGDGETATETAVEPLVGVYDWTPGGAACAACGHTVERRWREDGELVCAECKAW